MPILHAYITVGKSLWRLKKSLPWQSLYTENTWMSPPPLLQSAEAASFWLLHCRMRWGCAKEAAEWVQNPSCTPVWASGPSEAACSTVPPAACWRQRASGTAGSTLSWSVGRHGRVVLRSEGAAMPTQTDTETQGWHYYCYFITLQHSIKFYRN